MIKSIDLNKIKMKNLIYFLLLLYFVAISAYQLGTGFDAVFVRLTFILLFFASLLYKKKIIVTEQLKWYLLFCGFYFTSMIWAKNMTDTLYYANNFIQILGLSIILPNIIEDKNDINKVLKLLLFSILYSTILLIIRTPSYEWGTERLGEHIGLGPNSTGIRVAIASILSLLFAHNNFENKKLNNNRIKITFYLLLFVLFFVLLLFTGSKKALFIFMFGVIAFELINAKGYKIFLKILLSFLIVGIVGFLLFNNEKIYSVIGKRVENMYLTIITPTRNTQVDTSLLERNFYIQHAKKLFIENPILGYGGNNFVTRMREISCSHVAVSVK